MHKFKINSNDLNTLTYGSFKKLNKEYYLKWESAKNHCFKQWSTKPAELQEFCLDSIAEQKKLL